MSPRGHLDRLNKRTLETAQHSQREYGLTGLISGYFSQNDWQRWQLEGVAPPCPTEADRERSTGWKQASRVLQAAR